MEVISILGWICTFSSIAVQFVGIEICFRIWKKGSTGDISPAPFVANLIAACLWVKYGLLTSIQSVIIVNSLGALLASLYVIFFYIYTIRKNLISRFLVFTCLAICLPYLYIGMYLEDVSLAIEHLGKMCVIMTIVSYAAPLASLFDVFRQRSTDCMSFPLVLAYFIVSIEWFIYGSLLRDQYVQMPNLVGIALGVLQLGLFVVYPKSKMPSLETTSEIL
ncbi:sugar transporter SWEET1-like [Crassostrea virginica]|uniref:Sugar transporter SWEET1 n=1 Tax=Crassostrea virginica TaxID=6565 RepID=A0A8B8BTA5_CRAVI|nr:sugar transporter SWEET1-like [Crassostrea virginica]XP_022306569.1 sugar transporter SWEET1-like [Crassostrea virginica]